MNQPHSSEESADRIAPIIEVTLMEDRAHILRRGTLKLDEGLTRIQLRNIAPVIVDKTLAVKVAGGPSEVSVVRIHVDRRRIILDQDQPDRLRQLKVEARNLREELVLLEEQKSRCERELADLEAINRHLLNQVAEDAAWGKADPAVWLASFEQLDPPQTERIEESIRLRQTIQEGHENAERLQARIEQAKSPDTQLNALLVIDLHAEHRGDYELRIEYLVPNACWRPCHRAQIISNASNKLLFSSQACVWQNTGEDWENADLVFSTDRPSLGVEPPLLDEDLLHVEPRSHVVRTGEREQTIYDTGLGRDQGRKENVVPGIDDGGETVMLKSPARVHIRSDGRPNRVPLFDFECDCELELTLIAELAPAVILRSVQTNGSQYPLLAGPVDLIRNSGFSGRAKLMYISPGEQFELGWGPEPSLRATRKEQVNEERQRMLTTWLQRRHEIDIFISNLGPNEYTVSVMERIPVSEIEQVEIKPLKKEITDGILPDEQGFLHWELALKPLDHQSVRLVYELRKQQKVVEV